MNYEQKVELAKKVAPKNKISIKEVLSIIDELLISLKNVKTLDNSIDITIDEEYLESAIWIKTVMGEL